MSKRLFVYPIRLKRVGTSEKQFIGMSTYIHKENLNKLTHNERSKLIDILVEINSKQSAGLSDREIEDYFDKSMKKWGFKKAEMKIPLGNIIKIEYLDTYFAKN